METGSEQVSSEVSAASVEQPVSENTAEVAASPETAPVEGADQAAPEAEESGEQAEEFVKDDAGNEFISRKAFEARIAKLTAQKHGAVQSFLESLDSDPAVKEQVLEKLGLSPEAAGEAESQPSRQEASAFDSWLQQNVTPEHHAHYKQMADSLYNTMLPHIRSMWQAELKPMLSFIGKQEVQKFSSAHPDYNKYQGKIQEVIRSGRAQTLEDAYKLVAWDDKLKGVGTAAVHGEKARQTKLAGTPIRRSGGTPGATKPQYKSLKEAAEAAAKQIGW